MSSRNEPLIILTRIDLGLFRILYVKLADPNALVRVVFEIMVKRQ